MWPFNKKAPIVKNTPYKYSNEECFKAIDLCLQLIPDSGNWDENQIIKDITFKHVNGHLNRIMYHCILLISGREHLKIHPIDFPDIIIEVGEDNIKNTKYLINEYIPWNCVISKREIIMIHKNIISMIKQSGEVQSVSNLMTGGKLISIAVSTPYVGWIE